MERVAENTWITGGLQKARFQAENKNVDTELADKVDTVKRQPITGHVISSPMPGRILSVKVKVGDTVVRNQELLILEAMKMENSIMSDFKGKVKQILVAEGDAVAADAPLVELE